MKFGISFTATHYNQAGALLHVYRDGTVLLNHGGTEMGQGLFTKVRQVVAHELGVPLAQVRVSASDTSKVPNASPTAASSGTDLNAMAAQQAAAEVRARLVAFAAARFGCAVDDVTIRHGVVCAGNTTLPFAELTRLAYFARVPLFATGFYATPKVHYDRHTLTGRPFLYFAYGAAVSEVAIDTLTGEHRLLAVDILHDAGRSLNPAIDRGQVEGGFLQGYGWLTMEELCWDARRPPVHPRALDVQDPGGQRLSDGVSHRFPRRAERRGDDPSLEGRRRAAADAGTLRVPRAARCDRQRRRAPHAAAARRARDTGTGTRSRCGAAPTRTCGARPPHHSPRASRHDLRGRHRGARVDRRARRRARGRRTRGAGARRACQRLGAARVGCGDGGHAPTRSRAPSAAGTSNTKRAASRAKASARRVPPPSLVRFPLAARVGQCCGGVATLAFSVIDDEARSMARRRRAPARAAASHSARSRASAASTGTRLVVSADDARGSLGDAALDSAAIAFVRARLAAGDTGTLEMPVPGTGRSLLVQLERPDPFPVLLFGNGHVARALVQVLGVLPMQVRWVDAREEDFPASVPANVAVVGTDVPEAELRAAAPGASCSR